MTTVPSVLITGCSTGIGRATAQLLAARGWHVFATARQLDSMADLAPGAITPLVLDVTDEASCREAVESVLQQAGRIDALVNNAGYGHTGPLEEIPLEDVRAQFEVNTFAPLRLAQLVIPAMRAQGGGRIVNVSSVMGRVTIPFLGLYNASKFALEAMSDALRIELAPWGIRVILVEPGSVRTPFYARISRYMARTLENPESLYRDRVERAHRLTGGQGIFAGSLPETVATVIHKALTARRPRARYLALTMLALPDGWRDWVFRVGLGL
jgi:NAD(P)-dependent dehydrogenase (short-subunit alcohol dehydrogenase family)